MIRFYLIIIVVVIVIVVVSIILIGDKLFKQKQEVQTTSNNIDINFGNSIHSCLIFICFVAMHTNSFVLEETNSNTIRIKKNTAAIIIIYSLEFFTSALADGFSREFE